MSAKKDDRGPLDTSKMEQPQNTDAEASLLGAILIDADAIVKIADSIEPTDFFDARNMHIYEAIVMLYEKRQAIDVLTLSDQLKNNGYLDMIGGPAYLTELTNFVPTAAHVEQYAEIVAQKSMRRRLISTSHEISGLGFDESRSLKELIEEAETRLFQVSQQHVKQTIVSIEDILADSFERLDELHKDKKSIRGVPTGFKDMDNILAGLQKSDLFILAARPSMGKAQPLDASVLTTGGWKKMGDIAVGDELASLDGQPSQVTDIFPQGVKQIHRVTFSDGRSTEVCGDHLWKVHYRSWDAPRVISTDEVADLLHDTHYQDSLWIDVYNGEYQGTSRADRLSQLQESINIDKWDEQPGVVYYEVSDENKVNKVVDLARSLGALAKRETGKVTIIHPNAAVEVEVKRPTFTSIEPTRKAEAQCIKVSHPEHLYVTDGYTVTHNTAFVLNLAHNVAVDAKESVLVFSLEMSKEQLVDRLLSMESGVDAWALRTGNLTDTDFEKIGEAMGVLSEAPIFLDDTPGLTVSDMRTKSRREAHLRPIGLIIVDYLQLMSGGSRFGGSENRVQEISEISRGLKGIARELNAPVIALSQLSRSVESRTPQIPQLSDLRESGSIEQDADVVAFIYREDYYNQDTDRKGITDILIKKHRNGPLGNVELYFDKAKQRFQDLDTSHGGAGDPFE